VTGSCTSITTSSLLLNLRIFLPALIPHSVSKYVLQYLQYLFRDEGSRILIGPFARTLPALHAQHRQDTYICILFNSSKNNTQMMITSPALPLTSERARGMMLPAPIPQTSASADVCHWSICRFVESLR